MEGYKSKTTNTFVKETMKHQNTEKFIKLH